MAVQIVNFTQDELGPAWALRKQIDAIPSMGIGVIDLGDMLVTAGSGFGVNIATGTATVRQTVASEGGGSNAYYNAIYTAFNDGSASPYNTVSAPLTNPRLDSVILRIYDVQEQGLGGASYGRFEWLPGAETVGATLDNRSGAASLPANSLLLADVLQTVGEAGTGTIRDRRPFAGYTLPPSFPGLSVPLLPFGGFLGDAQVGNAYNNQQFANLFVLPRRIVNATKFRWSYLQDNTTALTGNYNIGFYDASGRQIVTTGIVAFSGSLGSPVNRTETFTSTTFEAGLYFTVIGLASLSATGSVYYISPGGKLVINNFNNGIQGSFAPFATLASGGTTLPLSLAAFGFGTISAGSAAPHGALSVT